jgi:hypothetical protein
MKSTFGRRLDDFEVVVWWFGLSRFDSVTDWSAASSNVELVNILLAAVQYDVDSREDQFKLSSP